MEPHVLSCPWTTPQPLPSRRPTGREIPNPLLLLPIAANRSAENARIATLARELRSTYPGIPVLLWCRDTDASPALLHWLDRIGASRGIRGAVVGDRFDPGTLRELLTDSTDLAQDVIQWLLDVGIVVGVSAEALIRRLVQATERDRSLERICSHIGWKKRTVYDRVRRAGPFTAGELVSMAVRLRTSLYLQRHHCTAADDVALELGFTPEGLRKHVKSAFGLAPGKVQRLLGIAPLLARWTVLDLLPHHPF